jgi:limonene-1,2-epoxide hydrolase
MILNADLPAGTNPESIELDAAGKAIAIRHRSVSVARSELATLGFSSLTLRPSVGGALRNRNAGLVAIRVVACHLSSRSAEVDMPGERAWSPLTHAREGVERAVAGREAKPADVVERLCSAMNQHDLEAFVACFDPDYRSEQPAHPHRGFSGREQVEKNWRALFEGIPDFHAELLATAYQGNTVWSEWHWTGARVDEAPLDVRGVTLFGIENGRVVSGRLYMEEVDEAGRDIDETVRRLAEGSRSEAG